MRKRFMVTGGAGFIGSAVVRRLVLEAGAEVLTIDKLTYAGNLDNLAAVQGHPGHRFLQADISDAQAMGRAFAEFRPTHVMHLAAESHVDRSISGPAEFITTNVVGTYIMLETALVYWRGLGDEERSLFRFHHVSTDEVYGSLGPEGAFSETSQYRPNSPYSASKAGADHLVRAWHHTFGLPVVTSNCSNNYGPYQYPEKLIPLVILNALEGKPLPVYGAGTQVRDWLHVEDHARALHLIIERGRVGGVYCVGGAAERRNIDVVRAICALLDERQPLSPYRPHADLIRHVTDRPGHDIRYAMDFGLLFAELGWVPARSFEQGLAETVAWYTENTAWCRNVLERAAGGDSR